jgi:transcriptional regulator
MNERAARLEIWQGTLSLMVLQTLATLGAQHGYGIARRIESVSCNRLTLNYGTLYPALLKLEQQGYVKTSWDASENNRRAKYYTITAAGRRQLALETAEWRATNAIIDGFLNPSET